MKCCLAQCVVLDIAVLSSAVFSVQCCAVCSQCAVCSVVHCALCIVQCAVLCIVHCAVLCIVQCRYCVLGRWCRSHTWLETPGQLGKENAFLHRKSSRCTMLQSAHCNVTTMSVQYDNHHSAALLYCSVKCYSQGVQQSKCVLGKNGQIDWLVLGGDQIKTGYIATILSLFLVQTRFPTLYI